LPTIQVPPILTESCLRLPINRSAAPAPIEESDNTATEAPKKEDAVVATPAAVEAVKAEEKKADEEVETKTAECVPAIAAPPLESLTDILPVLGSFLQGVARSQGR
jgi:hypothetical protein